MSKVLKQQAALLVRLDSKGEADSAKENVSHIFLILSIRCGRSAVAEQAARRAAADDRKALLHLPLKGTLFAAYRHERSRRSGFSDAERFVAPFLRRSGDVPR